MNLICFSGKHKRDKFCDAIWNGDAWQLIFLREASQYIKYWHDEFRFHSLTPQTTLAMSTTLAGVADLAEHLLENKGFNYVLLGKFSSDPLEGRFGWYRQLSGANFFISCKQLVEAEKKIRTLNIVRSDFARDIIFSLSSCTSDSEISLSSTFGDFIDIDFEEVSENDIESLPSSTLSVLYYVAGYIGRSISRRRKCDACKETLVSNCDISLSESPQSELLQYISRGGLSAPSDACFALCCQAYLLLCQLDIEDKRKKLLKSENQRETFVKCALLTYTANDHSMCSCGHRNLKLLLITMFNCFSKNLKRQLTSDQGLKGNERKLRKLQSSF